MAYLKVNDVDFSQYVNKLTIQTTHVYNARTNASGDKKVKYVNSKKIVTVGIIALNDEVNSNLMKVFNTFQMDVEVRDPETKALIKLDCILPKHAVEYYTIQADNVKTKAYTLTFEEL